MSALKKDGDLDEWRRGRAILGYIEGKRVVELADLLDVTRGSVNLDAEPRSRRALAMERRRVRDRAGSRVNATDHLDASANQRERPARYTETGTFPFGTPDA